MFVPVLSQVVFHQLEHHKKIPQVRHTEMSCYWIISFLSYLREVLKENKARGGPKLSVLKRQFSRATDFAFSLSKKGYKVI